MKESKSLIIIQIIGIILILILVTTCSKGLKKTIDEVYADYPQVPVELIYKDITGDIITDTIVVDVIYESFFIHYSKGHYQLRVKYKYPSGGKLSEVLKPGVINLIKYREL